MNAIIADASRLKSGSISTSWNNEVDGAEALAIAAAELLRRNPEMRDVEVSGRPHPDERSSR